MNTTTHIPFVREYQRIVVTVILFLTVGLISVGDARADDANDGRTSIKVGVIVPLTGPLAFFGKDYVRTYELAVEAQPDIKQRLDIVWEDSAYDSKKAVSAFNKLTMVDKVDMVYSFGGPMLNVLAPLAERQKIPFFATESQKSDCEGKKFCSLFRNEEDEWGKATWRILRAEHRKRIGIVKNQNQFMDTFVDALVRTKAADEEVQILIDVPPDAVDLRSEAVALKTKHVDALGVYLLPNSHKGFLAAVRSLKIDSPMFGVEEFLDKDLNAGFEAVINGTLVVAPGAVDSYKKLFESRFGNSAGFFYTPAFYDFLTLLRDTVSSNGKLQGADLVNALRFEGLRSGVSGNYSVIKSPKGVYSYSFPIVIYKVQPGSLQVVDTIASQPTQLSICTLPKTVENASWIQPTALTGDFDADGIPDTAELVVEKKSGKKGIAVCCSGTKKSYVIGAGTELGAGTDDFSWMNTWELFGRDYLRNFEEVKANLTPRDSLHIAVADGPGGIVYFNNGKFNWIQFGE